MSHASRQPRESHRHHDRDRVAQRIHRQCVIVVCNRCLDTAATSWTLGTFFGLPFRPETIVPERGHRIGALFNRAAAQFWVDSNIRRAGAHLSRRWAFARGVLCASRGSHAKPPAKFPARAGNLGAGCREGRVRAQVVKRIEADRVVIALDGQEQEIPADTVAMAAGMRSCSDVVEGLSNLVRFTWIVGDGRKASTVMNAIHSGFQAAMDI